MKSGQSPVFEIWENLKENETIVKLILFSKL